MELTIKLSALGPMGILSSKDYTFEKFKKLYDADDSLKPLIFKGAVLHCKTEVVDLMIGKNVEWNYHVDVNNSECECISCSGQYYNCKELAFRLSYDIWTVANEDPKTLSAKILEIQKRFVLLDPLNDKEIRAMICRNPKEAYDFLIDNGYDKERITTLCPTWLMNKVQGVPLKPVTNKTTATKKEVADFCNNLVDDDYLETCNEFVSKHPNDLVYIFAHAVCARNLTAVQHIIDLGILDYDIENPFNFFVGSPGNFKAHGSEDSLVALLYCFGFRPNLGSIKTLLDVDDYKTIELISPYLVDKLELSDLEDSKDKIFANLDEASPLIYSIMASE